MLIFRYFCTVLLLMAALTSIRAQTGHPFFAVEDLTGAWFDPSHDGEGITVEMLRDGRGAMIWHTYDDQGQQVWIVGAGDMDGEILRIASAVVTSGARFGDNFDSDDVVREPWGSIEITFSACDVAVLNYQGPAEFGSGQLNLTRLVQPAAIPCPRPRLFRLGFTPFPSDLTTEAIVFALETMATEGDITAHHFDDGIPWPEALSGGGIDSYDPAYQLEWRSRRDATPAGHQVFVSITPLNILRDNLAPYRGARGDIPLSEIAGGWDSKSFDHPDVKTAFLNHAINTVDFFQPDYLAITIEANLLMKSRPDLWASFIQLYRETYIALKQRFPRLPVMSSMTGVDLLPGLTEADPQQQQRAFDDVIGFSDVYAVSFYPHISALLTDPLPEDLFQRLLALSDKPVVITETGYPADHLVLADNQSGAGTVFDGTPAKQEEYFRRLFLAAEEKDIRFIINFVPRDYDALCITAGGCDNLTILWRDTGLFDENSQARPALRLWRRHFARPVQP